MGLKRDQLLAILVLLPSILLIALFVYGFIGNTVYVSMTDWGKNAALAFNPEKNFVGFKNYGDLFSGFLNGRFRQDLVNAIFYSFFLVFGSLIFGLFLAILLDRNPKGERFFQTIFLFPLSLSFIVSGTIWRWLLAPDGGINVLPVFIGLPKLEFRWLSSLETVMQFNWQNMPQFLVFLISLILIVLSLFVLDKGSGKLWIVLLTGGIFLFLLGIFGKEYLPTVLMMEEIHGFNLATIGIIIAAVWQYSGYTMALFLAGLRGISKDLVNAARLDGASEWQYYWRIAVPLLKPITLSAVIILSHISLKIFDLIFAMTGPDNVEAGHPSLLMYLTTFRANDFAKGAAIAVILFILAAVFIIPYIISSYQGRKAAEL
ncbi:sugar ABC transporter permease [bacterium]|nr:sugar ABC transporter permease [bacterium]